jgi:hypothetical protein
MIILFNAPAIAQIDFSAIADFVYKYDVLTKKDEKPSDINANFREDSPFNLVRVRVFMDAKINKKISVSTNFLFDDKATPRLDGVYAEFNKVYEKNFNIQIGLLQSPFAFSERTFSNINPLIGVPLVYHYRTLVRVKIPKDNADQLSLIGQTVDYKKRGLPILYDACWNTGIKFFGSVSIFEYNFAIIKGALSDPKADNKGAQAIMRLVVNPLTGIKMGVFGGYGPYISTGAEEDANFPKKKSVEDFNQLLYGIDFEYSFSFFEFYLEALRNEWDVPNIKEKKLGVMSGYIEGRYRIMPQLYYAIRYEQMIFDKIQKGNGSTSKTEWDYGIKRIETGFGFDIVKNVRIKLVGQINLKDKPAKDRSDYIFAIQLSSAF